VAAQDLAVKLYTACGYTREPETDQFGVVFRKDVQSTRQRL
jgi:hypothetical protein